MVVVYTIFTTFFLKFERPNMMIFQDLSIFQRWVVHMCLLSQMDPCKMIHQNDLLNRNINSLWNLFKGFINYISKFRRVKRVAIRGQKFTFDRSIKRNALPKKQQTKNRANIRIVLWPWLFPLVSTLTQFWIILYEFTS